MIINEAIRVKGVEFDLEKHKDKIPDAVYSNQYYNVASTTQKAARFSTTSTGKDVEDSKMKSRIESFDKERVQAILESEDIVKEYNKWVEFNIDQILRDSDPTGPGSGRSQEDEARYQIEDGTSKYIAKFLSADAQILGLDKNKIRDYIRGTFYYTSDNPNNIKLLLTLRMKYNQTILSLLNRMLVNNYKILGYTEQEMKALSSSLDGNFAERGNAIREIKERIFKNRDKFLTNNGECLDLTSLGFGKIFMTKGKDFNSLNLNKALQNDSGNETNAIDSLLQKSMKYDAIVITHGLSATDDEAEEIDRQNVANIKASLNQTIEYYKSLGIEPTEDMIEEWKKQLAAGTIRVTTKGKVMAKDNIRATSEKRWKMQPIRSDKSEYYDDMNSFIRRLIKEGYKKILIGACNPGSHKLDKDIMDTPGVVINYSDYSNIIENASILEYDMLDETDMSILEGEQELIQLAESYGIDYNSIDIDNMILNEGETLDKIKEYSKKVVTFIIGLFKKLWNAIKRVYNWIKEKITGKKGKSKKPIKLKLAFNEAASMKEFSIDDMSELEKLAKRSCDSVQKELQKRQQIQVKATKQLSDQLQRLNSNDIKKESSIYTDDLIEFLGYNTKTTEDCIKRINEDKLAAVDRKKLPDSKFGIPEKRKFPLNDRDHVIAAIKFFNRADKEDKPELARRIYNAMKKYNIGMDKVGKNNELRKYIEGNVEEYSIYDIIDYTPITECYNATYKNHVYNYHRIIKEDVKDIWNIGSNINYCKDEDGIFVMNESTRLRTPSYNEIDDIPENEIKYIGLDKK